MNVTKRVLPVVLLLLCVAGLHAQDYCSSLGIPPNGNIPSDNTCIDVDPAALFGARFCEWTMDSEGNKNPIQGDRVDFSGAAFSYTGYHQHLYSTLSDNLRPNLLIAPLFGYTDTSGCLLTNVLVPGFAGTYRLFALSQLSSPSQRQMTIGAHYITPPLGQPLKALTQTTFMQPFANYRDFLHSGPDFGPNVCPDPAHPCNLWVSGAHTDSQFARTAQNFWAASGGQQLAIYRCSLPEGGIADDDLGNGFNLAPGNWYYSIRSVFEAHHLGNSCDIISPSYLANDSILHVKVKQLEGAMARANCGFGQIAPDGSRPVDPSFWEGQNNLHVVCDIEVASIIPPGSPN